MKRGTFGLLCERLLTVLRPNCVHFEVIVVNDGSEDGSLIEFKREAACHREIKVVNLRRNYGQTAAIMAGIDHAAARSSSSIDADLQNDPDDIPCLLAKLEEGYDVVSGWRKDARTRRSGATSSAASPIA